jgi:hypothetical protein
MSGLKRRDVEYDILKQMKEDQENADVKNVHSSCSDIHDNKFTSQSLLMASRSPGDDVVTGDVIQFDGVTPFKDVIGFNSHGLCIQDSFDESVNSESHIQLDLRSTQEPPQVEARPDIEDLQREAYLAGLKAEEKDESGHPFAKMYRYLWMEK